MKLPFPKKSWNKQDWSQIKNLSKIDMISLLDKDPHWERVGTKGALYIYYNPECAKYGQQYAYVAIHYHREEYRDKGLLRGLIDHICWTRDDFKRWKVIK
jgi:hypothetical protein